MRTLLTLAAAVAINLAAFAALEWNVTQAQLPPKGEVTISQLGGGQIETTEIAPLARAQVESRVARTAASL